jgi:D-amino-acid dehydrogenase
VPLIQILANVRAAVSYPVASQYVRRRARLRRPVFVASPGYTLAPMENGIRLTSGVEFARLDAAPDFRRIRSMTAHAATVLSGLKTPPLSEWLGFWPSMPHSLPVIGSVRSQPNIVLAFGHGHLGLTLGPITGRLVAKIIQREEPPLDLRPFNPTRYTHQRRFSDPDFEPWGRRCSGL